MYFVLVRNGKKFNIALLLSIFVGWLGIDRFYLGYPALGQYVILVLDAIEKIHIQGVLLSVGATLSDCTMLPAVYPWSSGLLCCWPGNLELSTGQPS